MRPERTDGDYMIINRHLSFCSSHHIGTLKGKDLIMIQYACRKSTWMRNKVLDFLQTFVNRYDDYITDDDIFRPLEFPGAAEKLKEIISAPAQNHTVITHVFLERQKELFHESVRAQLQILWNDLNDRKKVRQACHVLIKMARQTFAANEEEKDIFHDRVQELQTALNLSDRDINVFLLFLAIKMEFIYSPLESHTFSTYSSDVMMVSNCLDITESEAVYAIGDNSLLRKYCCLDEDLNVNLNICLYLVGLSDEPLMSNFFRCDHSEPLPWSYFTDLTRKHGSLLKRLLLSGKPVNILLYGAPGTGKTCFARTLAAKVGKRCFFISQNTGTSEEHTTSSPEFRFGALRICNNQINPADSLIIVDEADNMLQGNREQGLFFLPRQRENVGDKGLLNSVLDTINTSIIWITNSAPEELDRSSRRRFDYSIRFDSLNREQRRIIWKNNINRLKIRRLIPAEMVDRFSSLYPVSAGGITQTLENLAVLKPRKKEVPALVDKLMQTHCELMGIPLVTGALMPSADYSLDGLNIQGDVKLECIVDAIRAFQGQKHTQDIDRPRMNLLLSGPPGTGKTEFVKYLGCVLNTKVVVKTGSDLLNMYVGGTEQNIRRAFDEAETEKAILFLDEIDGLVQRRERAMRSWEVTQVNQLLYQMECFNGVMIGATNLIRALDPAIIRRFTFKLEFNYLDNNGKRLFFERMFHTALTEDETSRLDAISSLAPGDFRTVRQSLFYYSGTITNAMRLDALERESEIKSATGFLPHAKIGF